MNQKDYAYRFLKNVRGSPAYFKKAMYDVLGMIRQLGIPTWFLTLSAADMQWPDVIQTIARQYSTKLTDEDVKTMLFEEKSKWLRQNPVTAARHFQYRINAFLQLFLKSMAHPLGELVDYAIRIEFQARGFPHPHTMILWIKDAPKLNINMTKTCATSLTSMSNAAFQKKKSWLKWSPKSRSTAIQPHAGDMASVASTTLVHPVQRR